jgi:hypothetical protein
MRLFVDETSDFFCHHMPEISPHDFFDKLLADPDLGLGTVFDHSQPDPSGASLSECVATEIRKAVATAFGLQRVPLQSNDSNAPTANDGQRAT